MTNSITMPITNSYRIAAIDTETTGLDVTQDRIIQLAVVILERTADDKFEVVHELNHLMNPTIPISPEAMAVHGITEEDIENKPTFKESAAMLYDMLKKCDTLLGFNINGFDIQIINEEFARCGYDFPQPGTVILDAGIIFKKMEERTLEAALRFYCGKEHDGAHDAMADVKATIEVFAAQMQHYPNISTDAEELAMLSRYGNNYDIAGKLQINDKGEIVYGFGKYKGKPVLEFPDYANWMLGNNFPSETKAKIRQLFDSINNELPFN